MTKGSVRRLQQAGQSATRRVLKLGADATTTVSARAPMLADPASSLYRAELTRMVVEKPPAFAASAWALATRAPTLMRPWQALLTGEQRLTAQMVAALARSHGLAAAVAAQQAWWIGNLKLATRFGLELSALSLANVTAALAPLQRSAHANAERLRVPSQGARSTH